ncbi:hypothetical protein LMG26857_03550 [Achromobacter anxifer]|uniref:hypothetical protein n=1 Tax=Achromobacter anxifer TaxID=1287737 RepID=UPI00155B92F9|nr:hypothetical protein [Achromobacter anxifer]CAB5514491.1 hypothetical protein LMG26857_03550 [Achromobacter anxifer]
MTRILKPTPGPWRVVAHNNPTVQPNDDWTVQGPNGEAICFEGKGLPEDGDNSTLIAEAGTVHHETGKSPRQLADELNGLEAARIAYASEFQMNSDCEPDVGSIHANIRALKAERDRLRAERDQLRLDLRLHNLRSDL